MALFRLGGILRLSLSDRPAEPRLDASCVCMLRSVLEAMVLEAHKVFLDVVCGISCGDSSPCSWSQLTKLPRMYLYWTRVFSVVRCGFSYRSVGSLSA